MGPGLTGNLVRARAKAIFYELDKDGSGGLTPNELQAWFARYYECKCVCACVCAFVQYGLRCVMYRALGSCVRVAYLPMF